MEISKSDWKLFSEKLPDWQENYMERLLKRYIKNLNDESKPASTKFWELEKQIKKDRRHPGVIMELEKSETVWNIVELLRKEVITQKELVDFSDDLQQEGKRSIVSILTKNTSSLRGRFWFATMIRQFF